MVISIDIGSTWTKGVLFKPVRGRLDIRQREVLPTTVRDLSQGFQIVLERLKASADAEPDWNGTLSVSCSSSAHGGLKMAAIGVVPGLTLKAARLAALSAGAKLVFSRSYRMIRDDLTALEESGPDMILLTGGTDGGNRSFILHNAELLGESSLSVPILYAGNRDLRDDVARILKNRELHLAGNVLPDLDNPRPDEARGRIRELFLSRIIQGKGLTGVRDLSGADPVPTPASLYDFLCLVDKSGKVKEPFCLVDMGGATTDCYSVLRDIPDSRTVLKGLREPDLKRTVEGDLGLRVSAASVLEAEEESIFSIIDREGFDREEFKSYVKRISASTEYLPQNTKEKSYDRILADFCFRTALLRHAGRVREVYSNQGRTFLQEGKNLNAVKLIIGTGGYLAASDGYHPEQIPLTGPDRTGLQILGPDKFEYRSDREYILPLLANAGRVYPEESVNTMLALSEGNLWN